MRYVHGVLTVLLLCACGLVFANEAARVEFFSPQRTVKEVRQATARFATPMVAFGSPAKAQPFVVDCPATGHGRWVDGRNWAYDFDADLPGGLRCRFTLKPDLTDLAGLPLGGAQEFSFDTGGAVVEQTLPHEGSSEADENQVFLLRLSAPATAESVQAHAYCLTDQVAERIAVDVLAGKDRDALLNPALRSQHSYFFDMLYGLDGEQPTSQQQHEAEQRLVLLRCRLAVPPQAQLRLVWGRGIATPSGVATVQDQVLAYSVREAFTAQFQCERVNADAACLPMRPMGLRFSAPVPVEQLNAVQLLDEQGHVYAAKVDEDQRKAPTLSALDFPGPFPERAKFRLLLPAGLSDDTGRALQNSASFPLSVTTDELPPLAKFSGEFGIIEWKEGGVLPVTLRNLEASVAAKQLPGKLQRLTTNDADIPRWIKKVKDAMERRTDWEATPAKELTGNTSVFGPQDNAVAFQVPKPGGGLPFEVVGIPLEKPGFYVVELASPKLGAALLGEARPRYVATTALVTNMAVHFKWGRESSVVWVTSLDAAQPVKDADVRISNACNGVPIWQGRTDENGIAHVAGSALPEPTAGSYCGDDDIGPLLISARSGEDLSFAFSDWNQGIETWAFNLTSGSQWQTQTAHSVLDRSLLRAGETVSMKHYLRQNSSQGFSVPRELPDRLEITHQDSEQKYTLPVNFDAQGIAESAWAIPAEAKLGTYQISLCRGESSCRQSGSFRVEQFRVPTMRAGVQPVEQDLVNAKQAVLDLYVNYLSGGGAASLPVKLRSQVRPRAVDYPDYEGYSFGGPDVKAGEEANAPEIFGEADSEPAAGPARVLPLTLDKNGAARATVPDLPTPASPSELVAELEYQDANGERLSVARSLPLWPAAVQLGIKADEWTASKDSIHFQVLALDTKGKPVMGRKMTVDLYQRTLYSHRRRLLGGFYAYENQAEIKRVKTACSGYSNAYGLLDCRLDPEASGQLILRATAEDDDGNRAISSRQVWVAKGEDWWFENSPNDRMDLLPEQKTYESGQTARFQVRMPFREATGLVTVEREGVIDAFTVPLSGKVPVIEVPIKPNYSPNVFVSVLAVRGRIAPWRSWLADHARRWHMPWFNEGGSAGALLDLSKPAYRLGMAGIDVGWAPNKLEVRVSADQDSYKVRERAKVNVEVKRADGGPLPADAEIALAGVDEGLLELKPNDSWKLLDAMMGRRGIEVMTSTAQMQVVGKRHYGRKAVSPGGGGGHQASRELFDTLLLWQGRVPLDAQGRAALEVPLNDSLTAFRLVAVASAGVGQFGTGQTSIRTTQDLMLHAGLPPLVREGDAYQAIFTVRNASTRSMKVAARAKVTAGGANIPVPELPELSAELPAGEAKELAWSYSAPLDAKQLTWEVAVESENAKDAIKVKQEVIPAVPVQVYQATLLQLTQPTRMAVAMPPDAIPGRGGLRLSLRAKLGDGLGGVTDYMQRYPYACLEQKVSKAVALRDTARWADIVAHLPRYIDQDGLLKYFPGDWLQGSDVLSSYVLSLADAAGWQIPEDSKQRLLDGLQGFVAGKVMRHSALPTADLSLRKLAAIEALSRYAAASPEMLGSISIDPNLWPTSALIDWYNLLLRLPGVPQHQVRLSEAQQILRARLNLQGSTLSFSNEHSDALWWLMISADRNAVRALLSLMDEADWREDIPRLVTGALARQRHGHWDTTTANAWGVLAMEKFSEVFEKTPVSGYTEASLEETAPASEPGSSGPFSLRESRREAEKPRLPERAGVRVLKGMEWSETTRQAALNFPWPQGPADLLMRHRGQGQPWVLLQSRAAQRLAAPLFTGYSIKRSLVPVEQQQPGRWSRGDIAQVKLELDAQSDMTWVVVDDPVPAGASILGSGLGGDSQLLAQTGTDDARLWPAFEERRFEAFRAYYQYVPKGKWSVTYNLRLNNPGRFELPPTRVEAMYAPEMFGELPNLPVEVEGTTR
ncbi:MAG: hypothetical protein EPN21_03605 [Methylococcaceae bacterium]|nr:MAG: hypothetical protein EPN21_03605 [Methylococcaceae bacterium]